MSLPSIGGATYSSGLQEGYLRFVICSQTTLLSFPSQGQIYKGYCANHLQNYSSFLKFVWFMQFALSFCLWGEELSASLLSTGWSVILHPIILNNHWLFTLSFINRKLWCRLQWIRFTNFNTVRDMHIKVAPSSLHFCVGGPPGTKSGHPCFRPLLL